MQSASIFLLQSKAECGIIRHGAFNGMARPRKSESLRTHADRKARARCVGLPLRDDAWGG